MRLSESLRRGIMEVLSGGIINRFKIKKRRVTLFSKISLQSIYESAKMQDMRKRCAKLGKSGVC